MSPRPTPDTPFAKGKARPKPHLLVRLAVLVYRATRGVHAQFGAARPHVAAAMRTVLAAVYARGRLLFAISHRIAFWGSLSALTWAVVLLVDPFATESTVVAGTSLTWALTAMTCALWPLVLGPTGIFRALCAAAAGFAGSVALLSLAAVGALH